MKPMSGQVVLITGASSGIGAALARECAQRGAHLALLARRTDRLQALKKELEVYSDVSVLTCACDVTRDGDLEKAVSEVRAKWGRLDWVFANAGFGVVSSFHKLKLEDFRRQFETNVFGVIRTAQATIEELKQTRGRLVLIGSVMSYVSIPGGSPYGMSKHAVKALSETLYLELRPHGVSVTHIAPGFVKTEIRQVDNQGVFHEEGGDPRLAWLKVPADRAARSIVNAAQCRKRESVITAHGKALVLVQRHFPDLLMLAFRMAKTRARSQPKG